MLRAIPISLARLLVEMLALRSFDFDSAGQNAPVLGRLQFNFHRAAIGFLLALDDRNESGSSRRRGRREAASRPNGAMLLFHRSADW